MTFHNFTDGDVLYAAQLNALAAALAADATSKDNVLRAQLQSYADGAFWRGTIDNLDNAIEPGLYGYSSEAVGAPGGVSGMAIAAPYLGTNILQVAWSSGVNAHHWSRYKPAASTSFRDWQPLDVPRDTGWRQLNSFVPGYVSGNVYVRRIGQFVTVNVAQLTSSASGQVDLTGALANGFAPQYNTDQPFTQSGSVSYARIYPSGTPRLFGMVAEVPVSFTVTYPTDQAWPAILPGTPA